MRLAVRDTRRGAPFSHAPTPRSAVKSSWRFGIEDRADDRLAVDLERQRRAEDRDAVREVGGAVERVEHPSVRPAAVAAAQFLGQDVVLGEARADERAGGLLHGDVDLGHEVDGALLVDLEHRAEAGALECAGARDDFDGGGEEAWVGAGHGVAPFDSACRFTMRISMPPSGMRRCATSSMKLRMRKMPRPLDFRRFSGASGSATCSGSKPSP